MKINKNTVGFAITALIGISITLYHSVKAVKNNKVAKAEFEKSKVKIEKTHEAAVNDELPNGTAYTDDDYENDIDIIENKYIALAVLSFLKPCLYGLITVYLIDRGYKNIMKKGELA